MSAPHAQQMPLVSGATAEAALTTEGFEQLVREELESRIEVWPARAFYPSSINHPCDRQLVWRFTRHAEQAPHDATLQSIFDMGNDLEPIIRRKLETLGFELVRDDRSKQWKIGNGAVISGRPDGRLVSFRGVKLRPAYIAELKSMSGFQFDRTQTAEDLRNAPTHWTRNYYAQGQLYALLEDLPHGVFVIESKATGMLRLIPFELDYAFAETLLKRIERLAPMVRDKVDPPPIPYDAGVCGGCGFNAICYPPRDFGAGVAMLDDAQLVEDLETRERLKASKAEYEELDKAIKARLKREGIKTAIAGPFQIEATERHVNSYVVKERTDVIVDIRRVGP